MTPDEMKTRWKEIEKHKDVLGWSLQTLGIRLGLNIAQITGVKAGKKTISNVDLNWLALLADTMSCIPRPSGSPIAGEEFKEPAMITTASTFQIPPFAQTIAEIDHADRIDPNKTIIQALATQFMEIERTGLSATQEEGAVWALGGIAKSLGIVDQVRAEVKALRTRMIDHPTPHPAAHSQVMADTTDRVPM